MDEERTRQYPVVDITGPEQRILLKKIRNSHLISRSKSKSDPMTTAVVVMSAAATAATTRPLLLFGRNNSLTPSSSSLCSTGTLRCRTIATARTKSAICCEVALRSESSTDLDSSSEEDQNLKKNLEKVGCKVRVKTPLKVYHVPKLPQLELTPDMVGVIKQYVGFWKGKHISPNYPFKVEFRIDVPDRGSVKFFAHLKEDEFEII